MSNSNPNSSGGKEPGTKFDVTMPNIFTQPTFGTVIPGLLPTLLPYTRTLPHSPPIEVAFDTSLEDALLQANHILDAERNARQEAQHKSTVIRRLQELLDEEEWLAGKEDPKQTQLEVEKKIRQLKGISLEDAIEALINE